MEGIVGCGLGLRREFVDTICDLEEERPNWLEITPENWIFTPRRYRKDFEAAMERFPVVAHGLSLSPGSLEPPDRKFLSELKAFLDRYGIKHYSEHLSFSSLDGVQTYELLPVPMSRDSARFIADKLKTIQDYIQRPVILENATYYYAPYAEMEEAEFIMSVLEMAETPLLLDVNNVYVNAKNHGFDPNRFIDSLDLNQVAYLHVAGHWCRQDDLIIDTHGQLVASDVWELLAYVLRQKTLPVLLERDNHIPPLPELMKEYATMETVYASATA